MDTFIVWFFILLCLSPIIILLTKLVIVFIFVPIGTMYSIAKHGVNLDDDDEETIDPKLEAELKRRYPDSRW